jgi:hypothetical protein
MQNLQPSSSLEQAFASLLRRRQPPLLIVDQFSGAYNRHLMSTLAYAALTTKREQAPPGTSTSGSAPGVRTYVDALAALVPAEVLALHAVILSFTTSTKQGEEGNSITTITEAATLFWAFFALILLTIVLYVVPRFRTWDRLDFVRAAIPPVAFVAWTMLQKATAFDAVCPQMREAPRTVVALFVAVFLGVIATALAYSADQKNPPGKEVRFIL